MRLVTQSRNHFHIAGRALVILIVLGLAVHIYLPMIPTLEHSVKVVQQMALWAVGLSVLAQALSYVCAGYLLRSIVHLTARVLSIFRAVLIVMAAYSLGMAAGGMVGAAAATYRWVHKQGTRSEIASIASTMPGFFNSSVLLLAASVSVIHLLINKQLSNIQLLGFTLILLTLISLSVLLLWGFRHRVALIQLTHRLATRWSGFRKRTYDPHKADQWFMGLFEAWELMIKGGWRGPALAAVLNVACDMLTLYFMFIAAGYPISAEVLLTGYGLPLLLGRMAFFIPGGIGVVEGTMAALYDGLGVPDSISVVVVLAYRLVSFWLPLGIGFLLIGFLENGQLPEVDGEPVS